MDWMVGVTTVPSRRDTLLVQTIESLRAGGFPEPRLFVDSWDNVNSYYPLQVAGVTMRGDNIRCYGNWLLGILELWIRNPHADRYAMFQDDVICYKNLRYFLEQSPYPANGYLNLYTYTDNEYHRTFSLGEYGDEIPHCTKRPQGWSESGWVNSKGDQSGRGALGLVFSKEALLALLTGAHAFERVQSETRGWKYIDGGVCQAMNKVGWREYVHLPSLVEHTGWQKGASTIGNDRYVQAQTWLGEDFDALQLLSINP